MSEIDKAQLMTSIRYMLVLLGTYLASHGVIANSQINGLVAAIMIIGPIMWAWWQNHSSVKAKDKAVTVGVAAGIAHAQSAGANSVLPQFVTPVIAKSLVSDFTSNPKGATQ